MNLQKFFNPLKDSIEETLNCGMLLQASKSHSESGQIICNGFFFSPLRVKLQLQFTNYLQKHFQNFHNLFSLKLNADRKKAKPKVLL